ncbi:N-acetylmuramoyl-L-alanine amidase [Sphingobacterium sp. SGG-5]|uniref:N-acetylmuramoyl-L-alanine amidase family protein n=1 Tax=Sphingobacterium sp. SGG-5 TaxID=2710881 RepID=UPI0013EDED0C|nr:N-acetylmuramoyl-L-alanine amidase [Sphingobacterium sp. SGG-5]NGM62777.1 N-acetylmuramoyl-L-alanine amidase [Sphingobacterium sp. SGG-5]
MNFLNSVKRIYLPLVSISILTISTSAVPFPTPSDPMKSSSIGKVQIVCLDAGHGGHDHGAVGRKAKEKDIALAVVLKLGKRIEEGLPGVKVIYTRTTDVYPKLYERPALANKHKADLFISVHCNSADRDVRRKNSRGRYYNAIQRNPSVRGTETLVCGIHRLDQQDVAIRENASILLEENYKENYNGFDPKDPSSYIVFKLMKRQYRDQSIRLASYMQHEFSAASRGNRGVKEQGLAVLATAGMPAVLTEIGFISSPDEEDYMLSDAGQKEIVENLFQSIKTYKNNVEK